jgi:hypothetical protein
VLDHHQVGVGGALTPSSITIVATNGGISPAVNSAIIAAFRWIS